MVVYFFLPKQTDASTLVAFWHIATKLAGDEDSRGQARPLDGIFRGSHVVVRRKISLPALLLTGVCSLAYSSPNSTWLGCQLNSESHKNQTHKTCGNEEKVASFALCLRCLRCIGGHLPIFKLVRSFSDANQAAASVRMGGERSCMSVCHSRP